jgi:hypothetical protein
VAERPDESSGAFTTVARGRKALPLPPGDLSFRLSIRATPGGQLTEAETGARIYYSEVCAELVSDG